MRKWFYDNRWFLVAAVLIWMACSVAAYLLKPDDIRLTIIDLTVVGGILAMILMVAVAGFLWALLGLLHGISWCVERYQWWRDDRKPLPPTIYGEDVKHLWE